MVGDVIDEEGALKWMEQESRTQVRTRAVAQTLAELATGEICLVGVTVCPDRVPEGNRPVTAQPSRHPLPLDTGSILDHWHCTAHVTALASHIELLVA